MDPSRLIPDALPIPVEWGWFYLFQILTFIIHILLMNVMLGGAIIALVHHLTGRSASPTVTRTISQKLPFTVAFAVNFGVAPLLFLQVLYGQFLYTSTVLMAVYWISLVGLIILAYASAYLYDLRYDWLGTARTAIIAVTAGCLLLVAFIFTNAMTLMLSPEHWLEYFTRPDGTMLGLADPTVIPRFLHFVASSIALSGLALALWSSRSPDDPEARIRVRTGMNWYGFTTMVQMALGLWFLSELPKPVMHLILGGSLLHTTVFVLGAVIGIYSISNALRYNVRRCLVLSLITISLMLYLRDLVRDAYLAPYYSVSDRVVLGNYLPLILFVLTLIVGTGLLTWVVRAAAKTPEVRS